MRISTKLLVNLALFIALAVVFRKILKISTPVGVIGFGGLPIILAGFIFGPISGAVVGALSDILGYPILSPGPYCPPLTLTAALAGMMPAMIYDLFGQDKKKPSFVFLTISIFIGQFITSAVLVSYFLETLFKTPFIVSFTKTTIALFVRAPLYAFLCLYLMKAYNTVRGKG